MSEREVRAKTLGDQLASRADRVAKALDSIAREVARTSETSNRYWRSVDVRVRTAYEELRSVTLDWTRSKLPSFYTRELARNVREIKASSVAPPRSVDFNALSKTLGVKQSLLSLMNETLNSFTVGLKSGEGTFLRLTRSTQQVLLTEKKVNKAVAEGYAEGGSVGASKRKLRDELLKKALDGKYVTVVDKNGDARQYDAGSYSEMVARTKLIEASSQSTLDAALTTGSDLVQVSSHNTICEECQEFEGKVFSISGNDPDFPTLESEPPFHPNCMHSMTVVQREALELDGTLEDYVAFSNDETETHPTLTGFVPVSER